LALKESALWHFRHAVCLVSTFGHAQLVIVTPTVENTSDKSNIARSI